jgi:hypothetical protein
MGRRFLFGFIFMFLMIIFLGEFSSSLGVTPARRTLNFEPGLEQEISFTILNNEGRDTNLLLAAQGELGEFMTSSSNKVFMSATEPNKELTYTVKLPEKLSPGLHKGEIMILEIPDEEAIENTRVLATLAVITQLHIYVKYPGKHAEAELKIVSANEGEDVTFVFSVVSNGKFDLTNVWASVDIYDSEDKKVGEFNTASIEVPSGDRRELVHAWGAEVPLGDYHAVASLIYDEGTINFGREFSVGTRNLVLQEIVARSFRLGEIAKLEMLVENKWTSLLTGVYVSTNIFNDIGEVVNNFESGAHDIEAESKYSFVSYWDTAGVLPGTYDTEVLIHHGEMLSRKSLRFKVSEDDLTILGLGYVISNGEGGGDSLVVVLIIVIVVLILINLVWFMVLRKRVKK